MTTHVIANATSARVGGGLSYITPQLAALERVRPDLDLRVLAAPWNVESLRAVLQSPVTVARVPNASARFAYEQMVLPLSSRAAAILYCPGNFIPLGPGGPPTVLTLQNPNYVGQGRAFAANQGWNRRAKIALSHRSLRRADRVVVISRSLAEEVRADLPDIADRMRLITSGAPRWRSHQAVPVGFPRSAGHLLSLANDYPHKYLDHLVEAWGRAFPGPEGPDLVMVGAMSLDRREAQRQLVPAARRANLVHLGAVASRAEIQWLLAHAAAMVATSALEAYPLTPAEAGSVGCPVVLTDIPAHREVAGTHARYVPVGDGPALASAIVELVTHPPERDRWTFDRTWDANATDLGNVFDELVEGVS